MYNGEWKENCNGSVLLSRSTASDSLKYCFPTMFLLPFLTSTGHLGCSGEDEKSLDMQEDDRIVICPFS